jgi:hypothetical protein
MYQMTNESTALAPQQPSSEQAPALSPFAGCVPRDYQQMLHFCERLSKSAAVPKAMQGDPMTIFLCIEMGGRLNYSIFQSLQNIAVINGKPIIYGDEPLARVRRSHAMDFIKETVEGEGESTLATCIVRRIGEDAVTRTFSVADAKTANLWKKPGPWTQYPKRMMQMKARNFALRDVFPDILGGAVIDDGLEAPEGLKEAKPLASITARPMVVETALGKFLKSISGATSLADLDSIAQQASQLTEQDAAKARPAFSARQKELRVSPDKALSKAQRIMQERLAEGEAPLDAEVAELFAADPTDGPQQED